jgi:periplasmic divalent cation tolerance protein
MTTMCVVLTTAGSSDEAKRIARALVERRVASCVNIVPGVESVYRWKGQVESAEEWLLVIKTRSQRFEEVRAAIEELHSYDLPECIMLEIAEGDKAYLDWLAKNTD